MNHKVSQKKQTDRLAWVCDNILVLCFFYTHYQILQNPFSDGFSIQDTEFPDFVQSRFYPESRCNEVDVDISVSFIGMMVPKHTIHYSFHPLLLVVYPNFQIVIPSENRVHYEIVSEIFLDGFFDNIHGFLQFLLVFSLEHYRRTNGL